MKLTKEIVERLELTGTMEKEQVVAKLRKEDSRLSFAIYEALFDDLIERKHIESKLLASLYTNRELVQEVLNELEADDIIYVEFGPTRDREVVYVEIEDDNHNQKI